MCVIMAKPVNVAFPEEQILKNCWDNNPDMGGFMYTFNNKVYIQKGYMEWEEFKSALEKARKKTGDKVPYVLHFRISTQGYDKECCQPFPLSASMKNMKKLRTETNIGVAHNGIITLTSDGSKDYSDTMKFIKDYLVNIIRSYDWYKDNRNLLLIENLIEGSRLSFLDKYGHIKLMGKGWIEEKGCYFSNHTYSYKKVVYAPYTGQRGLWNDYDDYYWDKETKSWKSIYDDDTRWADYWDKKKTEVPKDPWAKYWNDTAGVYEFREDNCPCSMEDDDSYCDLCSQCGQCSYVFACKKACGYED